MTEEEDRVANADQNNQLRRQFDPVLTEPIPARMYLKRPPWLDYARAAVFIAVGIGIGLSIPWMRPTPQAAAIAITPLPVRAARAEPAAMPSGGCPATIFSASSVRLPTVGMSVSRWRS